MNRPSEFELLVLRALKALILLKMFPMDNHYANHVASEINTAIVKGYKQPETIHDSVLGSNPMNS